MARFQIAEGPSKRSRRGGAWMVFLCLASLWISDPVRAQTSGQLTGQVKDATDAPLVAVAVTVRGAVARVAQTGPDGRFAFHDLPVGSTSW